MRLKYILIILAIAAVVVFGLPVIGIYFNNWMAASFINDELRAQSKPRMEEIRLMAIKAINEHDLPIDVEDPEQFSVSYNEETKAVYIDFYYVENVDLHFDVVPFEMELHEDRDWQK